MKAMAQHVKRARIITVLSIFSFTCFFNVATAAEQKKETKPKTVVKAKTTQKSQPKASPKIAAPAAAAISQDVALAAFDAFTLEWMKKLAETEGFHKSRAQIKQSLEGFSAEYTGYLPHRYIHVKKTESTDTPYVGILTYYEKTLRCTGKTKEEALQGPFDQVDTSQVSEIFRFTKGKWVY
jgi:hypothetical protein